MGECGRGGETVKSGEGAREKKKMKKKEERSCFFCKTNGQRGLRSPYLTHAKRALYLGVPK